MTENNDTKTSKETIQPSVMTQDNSVNQIECSRDNKQCGRFEGHNSKRGETKRANLTPSIMAVRTSTLRLVCRRLLKWFKKGFGA